MTPLLHTPQLYSTTPHEFAPPHLMIALNIPMIALNMAPMKLDCDVDGAIPVQAIYKNINK